MKTTVVVLLTIFAGLVLAQQPPGDAEAKARAEAEARAGAQRATQGPYPVPVERPKPPTAPMQAASEAKAPSTGELAKVVKAQTQAIQELSEKLTALEGRIKRLESKK